MTHSKQALKNSDRHRNDTRHTILFTDRIHDCWIPDQIFMASLQHGPLAITCHNIYTCSRVSQTDETVDKVKRVKVAHTQLPSVAFQS